MAAGTPAPKEMPRAGTVSFRPTRRQLQCGPAIVGRRSVPAGLVADAEAGDKMEPETGVLWQACAAQKADEVLIERLRTFMRQAPRDMAALYAGDGDGTPASAESSAAVPSGATSGDWDTEGDADLDTSAPAAAAAEDTTLPKRPDVCECLTSSALQLLVRISRDSVVLCSEEGGDCEKSAPNQTQYVTLEAGSLLPFRIYAVAFGTAEFAFEQGAAPQRLRVHSLGQQDVLQLYGWGFGGPDGHEMGATTHVGVAGPFPAGPQCRVRIPLPNFSLDNTTRPGMQFVRRGAGGKLQYPVLLIAQAQAPPSPDDATAWTDQVPHVRPDAPLAEALGAWAGVCVPTDVVGCILQGDADHGRLHSVFQCAARLADSRGAAIPGNGVFAQHDVFGLDAGSLGNDVAAAGAADSKVAAPETLLRSSLAALGSMAKSLSQASLGSLAALSGTVHPATAPALAPVAVAEPSAPQPMDHTVETQDCVICLSSPSRVLVLPCRHVCLCTDCAFLLRSQAVSNRRIQSENPTARVDGARCPICRTSAQSLVNIAFS